MVVIDLKSLAPYPFHFQVGQTFPQDQGFLQYFQERREVSDMAIRYLCVLIAVVKKKLHLDPDLCTILQILSAAAFEKTPILQLFTDFYYKELEGERCKQLTLFNP